MEKNKTETIADRLREAIKALGFRHVSDFISSINVKKSTVYAILNGKTKDPGSRILEKCYYAGINLNWLITGQGDMFLSHISGTQEGKAKARPYATLDKTRNVEEKIKDAMDDMLGMYSRLKTLREYASELEKLEPEQEKMFHNLVRTFLVSAQHPE